MQTSSSEPVTVYFESATGVIEIPWCDSPAWSRELDMYSPKTRTLPYPISLALNQNQTSQLNILKPKKRPISEPIRKRKPVHFLWSQEDISMSKYNSLKDISMRMH